MLRTSLASQTACACIRISVKRYRYGCQVRIRNWASFLLSILVRKPWIMANPQLHSQNELVTPLKQHKAISPLSLSLPLSKCLGLPRYLPHHWPPKTLSHDNLLHFSLHMVTRAKQWPSWLHNVPGTGQFVWVLFMNNVTSLWDLGQSSRIPDRMPGHVHSMHVHWDSELSIYNVFSMYLLFAWQHIPQALFSPTDVANPISSKCYSIS